LPPANSAQSVSCREKNKASSIPKTAISSRDNRGGKEKIDRDELFAAIQKIPLSERQTWRALAEQLEMPLATLFELKQKGIFRHSSPLKPLLTDEHKWARVEHVLSKRDPRRPMQYSNMFDEVHLDEKLYAKTKDGRTYLLTLGEELPYRAVPHKSYISKVIFLCAQARPPVVSGVYWDGKIGIWPIGNMKTAQRSSKN